MVPFKFDVIVISETWINDADDYNYINVPGYNCEFHCRTHKSGGGVAIFISDSLCYKRLDDIEVNEAESIFIEVKLQKGKVVVGGIYRPPDSNTCNFIEHIDDLTSNFQLKGIDTILIGDININLLDHDGSQKYVNALNSNGFVPYIENIPTRCCETTETLIAHIFFKY